MTYVSQEIEKIGRLFKSRANKSSRMIQKALEENRITENSILW